MKVIVLSGATATGKTDICIELARKFGGEVVNFDSLLLYKEITIGTAKPTPSEQGEIPHHMIDVASISNPLNAADYARMAFPLIQELHAQHKLVYLVGGSGFYLQALIQGMYDSPTTCPKITEKSDFLYRESGIAPFLKILSEVDPLSFERYHENDHYRVRRATEHFWNTGTPLSLERSIKDEENQQRKENIHGWEVLHLYLEIPREEHFEIIKKRTDRMLTTGLMKEVKTLLEAGFSGEEKPLQSIGYKEALQLISGEFRDRGACAERINISTRQLAKAQRTWFNRIQDKHSFHPLTEREDLFERVESFLKGSPL